MSVRDSMELGEEDDTLRYTSAFYLALWTCCDPFFFRFLIIPCTSDQLSDFSF